MVGFLESQQCAVRTAACHPNASPGRRGLGGVALPETSTGATFHRAADFSAGERKQRDVLTERTLLSPRTWPNCDPLALPQSVPSVWTSNVSEWPALSVTELTAAKTDGVRRSSSGSRAGRTVCLCLAGSAAFAEPIA
jgi:hypothetical protein